MRLYTCVHVCLKASWELGGKGAAWVDIERKRLMAQAKMYAWLEKLIKLKLRYDE